MTILNSVKTAVRISASNTAYNDELNGLINAARNDLRLSGVTEAKSISKTDALVNMAIITYVKAHFGWDNPDVESLKNSYEMQKINMIHSPEYADFVVTFTVTTTGAPVQEVLIQFSGQSKLTSPSGIAVFKGVKDGYKVFYVSKEGYKSISETVYIEDDKNVAVTLEVA